MGLIDHHSIAAAASVMEATKHSSRPASIITSMQEQTTRLLSQGQAQQECRQLAGMHPPFSRFDTSASPPLPSHPNLQR